MIVLLVVMVLTIVGLGVAYFTQLEDQTSGNIRLAKTAFYAAETGLRTGERALTNATTFAVSATELISMGGTLIALPGGGRQGIPLNIRGQLFDRLGLTAASGTNDVSFFSLYIRNNAEDPGNAVAPAVDRDNIINLISVGEVWTGVDAGGRPSGRLLATKILEEQIRLAAPGESFADQEGANQGGTNTGQIGPG
ncbi:MAG: hypothetical protein IPN03_21960 [Holophagales bacterium]|nr:hypothetical protein [Holophagales bacterium]